MANNDIKILSLIDEVLISKFKDFNSLNGEMIAEIAALVKSVKFKLAENIVDLTTLETVKVKLVGKSGLFTNAMKLLSALPESQKKEAGKNLNVIKTELIESLNTATAHSLAFKINKELEAEKIDVTLPVNKLNNGKLHPVSEVFEQVVTIFANLGFSVAEGPEIEDEWYNFNALNFTPLHPAKDDHDTFYFANSEVSIADNTAKKQLPSNRKLLRTHTSTVQIRTIEDYVKNNKQFPIKIIAPGRVYRSDDDATHTPVFHQVEGLYVGEKTSIAELKGVLSAFCSYFFMLPNAPLRFRPSYFPFTTPSFEVDIACKFNKDTVEIGLGEDWLEILGAGIVHPNVLKNCGLDPEKYQGYAFGMGIERITMLKYGFRDLREFFMADKRWLENYGFNILKPKSIAGGF